MIGSGACKFELAVLLRAIHVTYPTLWQTFCIGIL